MKPSHHLTATRVATAAALLSALTFAATAHAAVLATYDMAGSPDTTGDANDAAPIANLTVSNVTEGPSGDFNDGNSTWAAYSPGASVDGQTWWTRLSLITSPAAANDYVQFTLTPDVGFEVTLDSLSVRMGAATNANLGSINWELDVFASTDAFATAGAYMGTLAITASGPGGAYIVYDSPTPLTSLGTYDSAVTIRMMVENTSGSTAPNKYPVIDTISVEGSVAAVNVIPAPGALSAGLGLLGLAAMRRRHLA